MKCKTIKLLRGNWRNSRHELNHIRTCTHTCTYMYTTLLRSNLWPHACCFSQPRYHHLLGRIPKARLMRGLVTKQNFTEINKMLCEGFYQKNEKTNLRMEGNICRPYLTEDCYPRFTKDFKTQRLENGCTKHLRRYKEYTWIEKNRMTIRSTVTRWEGLTR